MATIVLTAVNSTRNRAKVANIQATLRNAQTAGEIYYNSNSFTYAGICTDPQIEEMMESMRNQGALVGCWVAGVTNQPSDATQRTTLAKQDWAITAYFNENNYSVNPAGMVRFDTVNTGGSSNTWNIAIDACSGKNARLPSAAQIRALRVAHGETAPSTSNPYQGGTGAGFNAGYYLSSTELSSSHVWRVTLGNGVINQVDKDDVSTSSMYVRCVS